MRTPTTGTSSTYRVLDAALLRATTHHDDLVLPVWPDRDDESAVEAWCAWLDAVWSHDAVADAITVASPVLAERVRAIRAGSRLSPAQIARIAESVARYLTRMQGRATPFGLFAGVAPLRFGDLVRVNWGQDHHVRQRADTQWVDTMIARLEAIPEVRARLTVMVNDLVVTRGERLVVPWRPRTDTSRCEVSVRRTPALSMILDLAATPITIGSLVDKLAAEFPDATAATVDVMVAQLISCGVLLSCLRPPSTVGDKVGYILDRLDELAVSELSAIAPLVTVLREVHTATHAVTASMPVFATCDAPFLATDLRLDAAVTVPETVAQEAAVAAEVLSRLTPHPAGHPAWQAYHARFLERYGSGGVLPLAQLVDSTLGLGFPQHLHPDDVQSRGPRVLSERDEHLLVLAQRAALDGRREITLDDDLLDTLTGAPEHASGRRAPHLDLCVDVRAATPAALHDGVFTMAVTGIGRSAVATSGRFLDLFPHEDRQRMLDVYRDLPVAVEGALAAQLSFPAHHPRVDNVAQVPLVAPTLLSVGEYRDTGMPRILVEDLAVTADHHRMYVVALSQRRVVEPIVVNALARHTMAPMVRLLAEIPRATTATMSPFGWGAAERLPFRPRVRYGRTLLAPARWRLDPAELPDRTATHRAFRSALAELRDRRRLPGTVHVGAGDRRLRLNLDEPMHLDLLRTHLDRTDAPVTLAEAPTPEDHGWIGGRAHELVIPLATTTPPAPAPAVVTGTRRWTILGPEHGDLPGSGVLSARLDCHPEVIDTIITRHLPALLQRWDPPPPWWFLRYGRPTSHLRLRLHITDYGPAAEHVGAWATSLRRQGLSGDLVLDTYRPELARYAGPPGAMAAAEALFAADSAAVRAQLGVLADVPQLSAAALTAASMVDLTCALIGGRPAGMAWLVRRADLASQARIADRDLLRQTQNLYHHPSGTRDAPKLQDAWRARSQAARRYVASLGGGTAPEDTVVVSLLHMHHVRAHGIDPDSEAMCHKLARAVALSARARDTITDGSR